MIYLSHLCWGVAERFESKNKKDGEKIVTTPLMGIRVLDLTTGPAAGIATMILADFGAEVLVVRRPGEDTFDNQPAFPMWSRGKKSV